MQYFCRWADLNGHVTFCELTKMVSNFSREILDAQLLNLTHVMWASSLKVWSTVQYSHLEWSLLRKIEVQCFCRKILSQSFRSGFNSNSHVPCSSLIRFAYSNLVFSYVKNTFHDGKKSILAKGYVFNFLEWSWLITVKGVKGSLKHRNIFSSDLTIQSHDTRKKFRNEACWYLASNGHCTPSEELISYKKIAEHLLFSTFI